MIILPMKDAQTITVLKALADPTRLKLVRSLASCPDSVKSCGDLSAVADLSQPAMSHHFTKLAAAGVVLESKEGTHKIYRLNDKLLSSIGIDIKKL